MGYSPWGCKKSDTTERLHFCMWGKTYIKFTIVIILSVQFSTFTVLYIITTMHFQNLFAISNGSSVSTRQ